MRAGVGAWLGPRDLVLAALALGALIGAAAYLQRPDQLSGRARVVDGDTLAIGDRVVRLSGIDAPEMAQLCGAPAASYKCGERARDALRALAHGHEVSCRVTGRDKYRRSLASCWSEGRDMGALLVRRGFAVGYRRSYEAEEREARRAAAGLWAGPFERPADWRRARQEGGREAAGASGRG